MQNELPSEVRSSEPKRMQIVPLGNRVIIRRVVSEEVKYGSIVIPETAREKPQKGEVVALGEMVKVPLVVGDLVVFGKYAGSEMKIDGEDFVIIRDQDIVGKVVN